MTKKPLEGIRVADFSWFAAGPIGAQTLATFGAEVVRVESETKIDSLRVVQPFARNEDESLKTGYNVSGYFNNFNAGKLSLLLNLNTEKGQALAHRLVAKCDVFITNFTPRARLMEAELRRPASDEPEDHRRLLADAGARRPAP